MPEMVKNTEVTVNNSEKAKTVQEEMRPFISLWTKLSPEFKKNVKQYLMLFRYQWLSASSDNEATIYSKQFLLNVHENWKELQKIISYEVIDRLEEISNLKEKVSELHKQKKSKEKHESNLKIKHLELEIRILRRFIDAMLWMVFDRQHSTVRRLPLPNGNDNLSKNNIIDSMIAANIINQDSHSMAIVSDLSTFVHASDIVRVDLDKGVSFIEVKSGVKNINISKVAKQVIELKNDVLEESFLKGIENKDRKHYERTKKQWQRLHGIRDTLITGKGHDYYTNKEVEIIESNLLGEYYIDSLIKCWASIKSGRKFGIDVIDNCIYIGVYDNPKNAHLAFTHWMKGTDFNGKVYNICDSFIDYFVQPFFTLPLPIEMQKDIINGDIIIVLCLDNEKFMEFGNMKHPNLFHLIKPSEPNPDRDDYMMVGKKAICIYENAEPVFLGGGLTKRIIFDLQKPESVIQWNYQGSDSHKN
ncbi:hypothetical protein [Cronobacter sakazakii]|uniref:hypothetical protein n=1 Tax=Cronobacter sakazakii TaxID=28141 RepID=UPI001055170C|nr:hypothetical protein [Cronobacter sakazakii]